MNCIPLPYTTRKLEKKKWNHCFQTLNNRQCRTDAWEEEANEVSPSIMLAFCLEAHARPWSRKRDAKENTAASPSWGDWDQNSENLRWLGAVVAQTSKEGVAMQNESPENLPKGPTPSLLTPIGRCVHGHSMSGAEGSESCELNSSQNSLRTVLRRAEDHRGY